MDELPGVGPQSRSQPFSVDNFDPTNEDSVYACLSAAGRAGFLQKETVVSRETVGGRVVEQVREYHYYVDVDNGRIWIAQMLDKGRDKLERGMGRCVFLEQKLSARGGWKSVAGNWEHATRAAETYVQMAANALKVQEVANRQHVAIASGKAQHINAIQIRIYEGKMYGVGKKTKEITDDYTFGDHTFWPRVRAAWEKSRRLEPVRAEALHHIDEADVALGGHLLTEAGPLQQTQQQMAAQLQQSREALQEAVDRAGGLEQQLAAMAQQNADLREAARRAEADLQASHAAAAQAIARTEDLETALRRSEADAATHAQRAAELAQALGKANDEKAALQQALDTAAAQHAAQLAGIQAELATANTRADALADQLAAEQRKSAGLDTQVTQLTKELHAARQATEASVQREQTLKEELGKTKRALESLQARMGELGAQLQKQTTLSAQLEETNGTLQQQLQQATTSQTEALAQNKQLAADLASRAEQMAAQGAQHANTVAGLQEQITSLNEQLTAARQQATDSAARVASLAKSKDADKRDLDQAKQDAREHAARVASLTQQNGLLQAELREAKAGAAQAAASLSSTSGEANKLRKQVADFEATRKDYERQLADLQRQLQAAAPATQAEDLLAQLQNLLSTGGNFKNVSALYTRLTDLEGMIKQVVLRNKKLADQTERLNLIGKGATPPAQSKELASLSKKLGEAQRALEERDRRLAQLEKQVQELMATQAPLEAERSELQTTVVEADAQRVRTAGAEQKSLQQIAKAMQAMQEEMTAIQRLDEEIASLPPPLSPPPSLESRPSSPVPAGPSLPPFTPPDSPWSSPPLSRRSSVSDLQPLTLEELETEALPERSFSKDEVSSLFDTCQQQLDSVAGNKSIEVQSLLVMAKEFLKECNEEDIQDMVGAFLEAALPKELKAPEDQEIHRVLLPIGEILVS